MNDIGSTLPASEPSATSVHCSPLERMPKWLICVPLVLQWLWLSLRYRCTTLPSVANPAITAGGLVGETKLEYFNCMGPVARAATALHCAVPPAVRQSMPEVRALLTQTGLAFPLIAKPDLGLCGFGVCLLPDEPALTRYVAAFPPQQTIVLQEYLPQAGEAGIFYARQPGASTGQIIGLALRFFPQVIGNGESTLAELISADPRAGRIQGRAGHVCPLDMAVIPAQGQMIRLATIGSTRVGGLYRDGGQYVTAALLQAVDAIARDMDAFYFGRFDVRFSNLTQLASGQDFKIMEVNGAGSEAIQAWDPDTSLVNAFRIIFSKQRLLFAIGAANRRAGHRPISLRQLARLHFMQQRLLDQYPPSN